MITYQILKIDANENPMVVGNASSEEEAIEKAAAVGGYYKPVEVIDFDGWD